MRPTGATRNLEVIKVGRGQKKLRTTVLDAETQSKIYQAIQIETT